MTPTDPLIETLAREVEGRITVAAEDICEDDILEDSEGTRYKVTGVDLKPKTVVLHLYPLNLKPQPFRCKRGERVEVERG